MPSERFLPVIYRLLYWRTSFTHLRAADNSVDVQCFAVTVFSACFVFPAVGGGLVWGRFTLFINFLFFWSVCRISFLLHA